MVPKLRLSVPNGENEREKGTFLCRGRFPAERAGFAETERERWPFGAVSHSVTSIGLCRHNPFDPGRALNTPPTNLSGGNHFETRNH